MKIRATVSLTTLTTLLLVHPADAQPLPESDPAPAATDPGTPLSAVPGPTTEATTSPPAPAAGSPKPPPPSAELAVGIAAPPVAGTSDTDDERSRPLAGWHGAFFLRDPQDRIVIYPRARMHVDFHQFLGSGVHDIPAADGGNALKSRLFIRRMRLELAGELLGRVAFYLGGDLGGQAMSNPNGKSQTAAGAAGKDPTADSARFAPVQSAAGQSGVADAYVNVKVAPELQLMLGQLDAPMTLENRTNDNITTFTERNVAIRGFVIPTNKEIGIALWGELGQHKIVCYEGGVFAGDGQNRPTVDNRVDFIGRIFARPFIGTGSPVEKLQVGVSAHHGDRDSGYVGYDYPAITTGQGYALWSPGYKDSAKRSIHVIPSGAQNAIGGELRLPVSRLDLRGELYYVANRTREAVDGYQLTNTERLGAATGMAFYAQVSYWAFGDAFVTGDPGFVRPTHVDFKKKPEFKKGLELYALFAGISASYDGASRGGAYDTNTPGAPGNASDIVVRQVGLGTTYWYTRHLRASLNWSMYQTPGSGSMSASNLAAVPGNRLATPDKDAHTIHEISTRVGVMF